MHKLEMNGGLVSYDAGWLLTLPANVSGYADAQIGDYGREGRNGRSAYPHHPNTRLRLRARFSHDAEHLVGTAGFGFWNAPFGDPSRRWPALPQATWFFFGSPPTDLPLAANGAGRGWFAATLDATSWQALSMAPLAPAVVLLNRWTRFRRRFWPVVQQRLGISYAQLTVAMSEWHDYELIWQADGCRFLVGGEAVLQTSHSPRGPLGFVCWLDNQFMVVTNNGRFRWGVLPIPERQTLEVCNLLVEPMETTKDAIFPS